ncbi:MAG: polyphenol oxidase family protein [Actinomycetes bacterium]
MLTGSESGRAGAVRWLFTDRAGGVSVDPYSSLNLATHVGDASGAVSENRAAGLTLLSGAGALASMRPTHGTGVAVVTAPGEAEDVDALVTTEPGLALLALGADCVPVVLFDLAAGVVGAVHTGWRGLRDDVVGAALSAMLGLGARGQRIEALLGPAICGPCYPVPAERAQEIEGVAPPAVGTCKDGQPSIDLRVGISYRLARSGVSARYVGGCTAEDSRYFSHRRDGITGRQGAFVVLDRA